jgi:hypothetical protein
MLRGAAKTASLERIAVLAVADIEPIPDDGEHHRVRAIQKLTVFDGLEVHVGEDVRGAMTIPAKFVANFRLETQRAGHCQQYTASWIGGKGKSALELTV